MFAGCTSDDVARGRMIVRLFLRGWPREVVVDTLLPCDAKGKPLFCGLGGGARAAIVEKAFAKLCSSYAPSRAAAWRPSSTSSDVCETHEIKRGHGGGLGAEQSHEEVARAAAVDVLHAAPPPAWQRHAPRPFQPRSRSRGWKQNLGAAMAAAYSAASDPAAVRTEEEEEAADLPAPSFAADVWVALAVFVNSLISSSSAALPTGVRRPRPEISHPHPHPNDFTSSHRPRDFASPPSP